MSDEQLSPMEKAKADLVAALRAEGIHDEALARVSKFIAAYVAAAVRRKAAERHAVAAVSDALASFEKLVQRSRQKNPT